MLDKPEDGYWHTASFGGLFNNCKKENDLKAATWLMDSLDGVIVQLAKHRSGPKRARLVHRVVDKAREKWWADHPEKKAKISCKAGCAFCCHILVDITEDEAMLLAKRVRSGSVEIDRDALRRQAEYGSADKEWLNKPSKDTRCVFLGKDNLCNVYDDRPASCRSYNVVSPPSECDKEVYPMGKVLVSTVPEGEIIASAAMNISRTGSLPKMVLDKL